MNSVLTPIRDLIDHDLRSFRDLWRRRPVGEDNITSHQQEALKKLKSRHDIIIKLADKGGQIVIQDRTNYILEATLLIIALLHSTCTWRLRRWLGS